MLNSKEKIIIAGICIFILVFAGVLIVTRLNIKKTNETKEPTKTIYSHQVIDVEDIEKSAYESKKITNFKIASKYPKVKEVYTTDAKIDMYLTDNSKGQILYVRDGNTKLNILQFKYNIHKQVTDEDIPEVMQVDQYIQEFHQQCVSEIGAFEQEQDTQDTYIDGKKIPVCEKVYLKNQLHSVSYKIDENPLEDDLTETDEPELQINRDEFIKNYDINFYMDGPDTLVCELVRVL